MATLTLIQAVNDALKTAMRTDPNVLVFGEDVGPKGGVFLAALTTRGPTSSPPSALRAPPRSRPPLLRWQPPMSLTSLPWRATSRLPHPWWQPSGPRWR